MKKRQLMLKDVLPQKFMLVGLFAFCMSFFGVATQAEAQSKLYIPADVAEMQSFVGKIQVDVQGAPAQKVAYYNEVISFYQTVIANVQGGSSYHAAVRANIGMHPGYVDTSTGGSGSGGGASPNLQIASPK